MLLKLFFLKLWRCNPRWHPYWGIMLLHGLLTCRPAPVQALHHMKRVPQPIILPRQSSGVPLIITNSCPDTIYPAILTQSGNGPGTGGFELSPNSSQTMTVAEDWQGRVWGRTNCSFGGSNSGGGSGGGCQTGDCGGVVSCSGTGNLPTTLAEFTLNGGDGHTYYDISLVDGYNLPLAIVMHPSNNNTFQSIPQSLTNPSCVATVGDFQATLNPYSSGQPTFLGTTASDPLPFLDSLTVTEVAEWCPWNLQVSSSTGPSGGVYIYPDGNLNRPTFDPCLSDCAKYRLPQYCCTGAYGSPGTCSPSAYSKAAKSVCPDAYSYAFDDQTSTFIIPAGAGFEVVFCPGVRSTNIIATSKDKLVQLAQTGSVTKRDHSSHLDGDNPPVRYDLPELVVIANANDQTYGVPSSGRNLESSVKPLVKSVLASLAVGIFIAGMAW